MLRQRQLNLNDLGEALRMPAEEAEKLSAPILADLRELEMPGDRDPAGIPYRGGDVFRELMDGRPISELRAAYVTLRRLACQQVLIDTLEIVTGTVADYDAPMNEGHQLDLRFEPAGYRYYLAGKPLHAGDTVELFVSETGWTQGRYEWNYQPERPPFICFDDEHAVAATEEHRFRWPE